MDTEPIVGKQLDWKDLLPSFWRNANIQSPEPMPAMPVPEPIPAIQCLILADTQQPEDVIWNYQTPCNISDHAAFSPTDVSNMDTVWSSANTICYSTTRADLGEMLAQPKHKVGESAAFVLEHVALILGVAYAIYWAYRACCGRRKTRAAAREPLSMEDLGAEAIAKADRHLKQLVTAERQRDEVLAANGELLEEHARQEQRINEADDATNRLEKELANLKNELGAAEEKIGKSEEKDAEWDAKYDDLVVQNTELRKGIAALTKDKNNLIMEKRMRDKTDRNAETKDEVDRFVMQDINTTEAKDLQDLKTRLSEAENARDEYIAEINNLKDQLASTQNQVNSMYTEAELNEERANHDLTRKAFDDTKVELEFIQDKLDNAAWKIEAAENKQESAEELVRSRDNELTSAMEKLRSFGKKLQVAEDIRASLKEANEQLKASVHKLSKKVESKKTEVARKEIELNTHLETCKGSSTNASPEDKDLFGPDPNQELLQERDELLGELATAENNKSVAEAEKEELAAKLHEREQELSNSHANDLAKVQETRSLQRQVNKYEKEVKKLHATILTRNRKINQLELDLKRARGEYESESEEGQAYNAPYGGEEVVVNGPEVITSNNNSHETQNAEDTQSSEHFNKETNKETEADPDSNSTEDIMNAFMEDPTDNYTTWAQGQQSEGQQGMSSTEDLDAVVCEDWAEHQRNEQSDEPVGPIASRAVLGQDSGNHPEFDISLV
jgi:chromosome segregation ATPase